MSTALAWWQDPEEAPSRHEPADPPLHLQDTPEQADRRRRQIDNPWAEYMVAGRCTGCGGQAGHASQCVMLGV